MDLLPSYMADENGAPMLMGYFDPFGTQWRQGSGGGWEMKTDRGPADSGWVSGDPNRKPLDLSGLNPVYITNLGIGLGYVNDGSYVPGWEQNPYAIDRLFDLGPTRLYGRGANMNPYETAYNRDAMRALAGKLGLNAEAADMAALREGSSHYVSNSGFYDEATSPLVIADDIARSLFAQAERPYTGVSTDERAAAVKAATNHQQYIKDHDPDTATDWADAKPVAQMVDAVLIGLGSPPVASAILNLFTPNAYGPDKYNPKNWSAALAGLAAFGGGSGGSSGDGKGKGPAPHRRTDSPEEYKFVPAHLGDAYQEYLEQQGGLHG